MLKLCCTFCESLSAKMYALNPSGGSYYAELRYYKPQSYRPILTAGLQLGNAMKSAKLEQARS